MSAFPDELAELVRIPSVGADQTHLRDCVACATWLRKWLGARGFATRLVTEGFAPPVLLAERKAAAGADAPAVLVYGHYDVQPADPLSAWETPPFEPVVRDGRLYGRGAQDDKGQLFAILCGIDDFLKTADADKVTLKIVAEGQEESGSAALTVLAPKMRRELAADLMLVCDTSAAADLRPAIVAGLRGVAHFTLRLTGPSRDLHSGEYGGIAPNPAQGMCELIASLHNPDGSVAVAGFRDGIENPSHEERRRAEETSPSEGALRDEIGCDVSGGQVGKTIAERVSFEPTIEMNGICAGHYGQGAKTVIPREAIAKLSMRLVPGQIPHDAFAAVRAHLESRVPRGLKLAFEDVNEGSAGFRLPLESPVFRLAESVLGEMDGRGPVFVWDGASIPVLSVLREASGAAPVIVGWGQSEDCIHAPNESYSERQFALAREWGSRFLSAFAQLL